MWIRLSSLKILVIVFLQNIIYLAISIEYYQNIIINNFLILLYYWIRTYVLYLIIIVTLITLCHQLAHILNFLDTLTKFIIINIYVHDLRSVRTSCTY